MAFCLGSTAIANVDATAKLNSCHRSSNHSMQLQVTTSILRYNKRFERAESVLSLPHSFFQTSNRRMYRVRSTRQPCKCVLDGRMCNAKAQNFMPSDLGTAYAGHCFMYCMGCIECGALDNLVNDCVLDGRMSNAKAQISCRLIWERRMHAGHCFMCCTGHMLVRFHVSVDAPAFGISSPELDSVASCASCSPFFCGTCVCNAASSASTVECVHAASQPLNRRASVDLLQLP